MAYKTPKKKLKILQKIAVKLLTTPKNCSIIYPRYSKHIPKPCERAVDL